MFNLFRLCRKDELSFDIVAKTGNIVESTFNFVDRIVRPVAFDNAASTLLLVWTGLKAATSNQVNLISSVIFVVIGVERAVCVCRSNLLPYTVYQNWQKALKGDFSHAVKYASHNKM